MAGFLGVCHLSFWCQLVCLFGDGGSVFISHLTFFMISIFSVRAIVRGCLASFLWVFGIHHGSWVMCEWGGGFGSWVWVWRHCLALLDIIPPSLRWCHMASKWLQEQEPWWQFTIKHALLLPPWHGS